MDDKNWEEDLKKWGTQTEENPNDAEAWMNRGIALDELGKKNEALECYDKAININPDYANAWNNKGIVLLALGKKEKALECYKRAIEINPNYANAWNNKGFVLNDLGKKKEALKCYEKATDINPNNVDIWNNMGISLTELCENEEALECYEKATNIDSNDVDIWNNKGNVLDDLGRKKEALKCYDHAIEINPNYANAWNNKGVVLESLEKREEALQYYIEAIRLNHSLLVAHKHRIDLCINRYFLDSLNDEKLIFLWGDDHDFNSLTDLANAGRNDLIHINLLWGWQRKLLELLQADNVQEVGHYTSSDVFYQMIQQKGFPLKLCSLAAANDPMEGNVLQMLRDEDCCAPQRIQGNLTVLQASFSAAIDSLNQFRLYGKKDGIEGTGLCLVFAQSFFADSTPMSSLIAEMKMADSMTEDTAYNKRPLHWVLYYDRSTKRIYYTPANEGMWLNDSTYDTQTSNNARDARRKLKEIGEALKQIKKCFLELKKSGLDQMALGMLVYLRHLIKDAAFMDEKELRVLKLHRYGDKEKVKLLNGKNCLACDYLNILQDGYLKKVIAGPKVYDFMNMADVWKHQICCENRNKDVEFIKSQTPLH